VGTSKQHSRKMHENVQIDTKSDLSSILVTRTIEFQCFAPETGNRAQILYIAAYNKPKMSLALYKIGSNSYISACAHPRMSGT